MTIAGEIHPMARKLAHRLSSFEKGVQHGTAEHLGATCRVCEKLRRPLSHLVGKAGVSSLFQRALILAQRESPALARLELLNDGSSVEFDEEAIETSPVLIAHLIQLLITFIGEGLTLRLVQDIWPEINGLGEFTEKDVYER